MKKRIIGTTSFLLVKLLSWKNNLLQNHFVILNIKINEQLVSFFSTNNIGTDLVATERCVRAPQRVSDDDTAAVRAFYCSNFRV